MIGELPGQLALPEDFVRRYFFMPRELSFKPCELLPVHRADGKGAPKYRPVRYDDWIKAQTKPWRRPPDVPLGKLLSKLKGVDGVTHETVPDQR